MSSTVSLVHACRQGDQEAWALLVRRFAPLVGAIVRSHGLAGADCEDVSQATWVRLWRNVDQLRNPDRLAEWLSVVARREALRHLAVRQAPTPTDDLLVLEGRAGGAVSAEDEAAARDRLMRLRAAFRSLPPRCQHLLGLLVEERTYAEAAEALGMPAGSVGPVRSRCLDRLRRALRDPPGGS